MTDTAGRPGSSLGQSITTGARRVPSPDLVGGVADREQLAGRRPAAPPTGSALESQLMRAEESEPVREPGPVAGPAGTGPGVLIADDDPFIRGLLRCFCAAEGFRCYLADGGEEAVELYRSHRGEIDVVLLDVRMPGLGGHATLAALRGLDPGVRCCFMSGDLGDHTAEELVALGACHLFSKPLNLRELAQTLRRVASRRA